MVIAFQHLMKKPTGDTEVANRGIRVYTILGCHESGDSPEEIADDYALPIGAVYEALAYAADHPSEMQAIRQEEAAITRDLLGQLPKELIRDLPIRVRRDLDLP